MLLAGGGARGAAGAAAILLALLSLPATDGEGPSAPPSTLGARPSGGCWGGALAAPGRELPLAALRGGRAQGDAAAVMRAATQGYADRQLQQALQERMQKEIQARVQAQVQQKVQQAIATNMMTAAQRLEQRLDDRLIEEGEMSEEELEKLREARARRVKQAAQKRRQMLGKGHGSYEEVDERDFFAKVKQSQKVVVHFYRATTFRCMILDKHLRELAHKHLDCLFIRINVEKAPFLVDRLNVRILPCIKLVKAGEVMHTMIGFEEFGGHDEFKSKDLVAALARHGFLREGAVEEDSGDPEEFDLDAFSDDWG